MQDIGPTLMDLAGLPVPDDVDGRSFAPILRGEDTRGPRERVLLELWALGEGWRGLRTRDMKYARWQDGRCEVFQLDRDPDEKRPMGCSFASDLALEMERLSTCRGRECAQLEDEPPTSSASLELAALAPAWCAPPPPEPGFCTAASDDSLLDLRK
jgi:arylsulfatase A-like enzyme